MTSEVSIIYRLIVPLFKVFKNIFWLAYKLVGFHVACSYISLVSLFHEFYLLFLLPLPSLFKHCHPQYSLPLFPYHICTIFLAFLKTSFLSHNDFFLASRSLQEFQDKQSKKCKSVPLRKGIRCLTFWGWVTSFSIIFFYFHSFSYKFCFSSQLNKSLLYACAAFYCLLICWWICRLIPFTRNCE